MLLPESFAVSCSFFLIRLRTSSSSKTPWTNRKNSSIAGKSVSSKCAKGYGTEGVLVDVDLSGR